MELFEEPSVYVILDGNTIYLLPKEEEKPVCFYEPDRCKIQEDGTLTFFRTNAIKAGN